MPNRIMRTAVLFVGCSLILTAQLYAQAKAAPKMLTRTTSSDAASVGLTTALEEAGNIGGTRRLDPKLKAVVDADPSFALGRAFYGALTANMSAADRTRELEAAVAAAGKASAPEIVVITALREWRAGRNAVARELFDVAIRQVPEDPVLPWLRTFVAANVDDALRIGEAAIQKFPDYAPMYNLHAYRLNTAGRKDEAFAAIQKYVDLAPNHPNSHDSFAEIMALNGRYAEAITHYGKALELDPKWDAGHEGLAEVAAAQGNYAEARTHLQHAIALAPTPARKLVLMREVAATHLSENKLKEARAVMSQVVAEGEANSLNTLGDKRIVGMMLVLEGRTAEGTTVYTAAQAPTPGPNQPVQAALFHAFLKHPAEVAKALTAMEANAAAAPDVTDTQDALRTTRVVNDVVNGRIDDAFATLQQISTPVYRALAGGFIVQGARKAKNTSVTAEAMAAVDAYKAINLNAGLSRYLTNRK